jgi:L-ascorbate metabolism protein UlaG (beta-lactamase superfamily)
VQLTKFDHSCVTLTDAGRTLVIDPGTFSDAAGALRSADAVLITHEHPDHIDVDAVRAAAEARPELAIWGPPSVADLLPDLGDRVTAVGGGQSFAAAGFSVRTFGGQHALIHPAIPIVSNVGYLIDGGMYHPGDSLIVPDAEVTTLLAPIHAPWSRVGEVVDFIIAVRAPHVYQIHDALLNENGLGLVERLIPMLAGPFGVHYEHLATASTIDL